MGDEEQDVKTILERMGQFAKRGDVAAAIHFVTKNSNLAAKYPDIYMNLASILIEKDKLPDARALLVILKNGFPYDIRPYSFAVYVEAKSGDIEATKNTIAELLEKKPAEESSRVLSTIIRKLAEVGYFDAASMVNFCAKDKFPEDPYFDAAMGVLRIGKSFNHSHRLKSFKQELSSGGDLDVKLGLLLAIPRSLRKNGYPEQARDLLKLLVEHVPSYIRAYDDLAYTEMSLRNYEGVYDVYKESCKNKPPQDYRYGIIKQMAQFFIDDKDYGLAKDLLDLLIDFSKNDPYFHNTYANLALYQGDLDLAEKHYNVAGELQPDVSIYKMGMVKVLVARGETELALAKLAKLAKEDPSNEYILELSTKLAKNGVGEGVHKQLMRDMDISEEMKRRYYLDSDGYLEDANEESRNAKIERQ